MPQGLYGPTLYIVHLETVVISPVESKTHALWDKNV